MIGLGKVLARSGTAKVSEICRLSHYIFLMLCSQVLLIARAQCSLFIT